MIEIKENSVSKALFIGGICQGAVSKEGMPLSPYMKPVMEHIAGLHEAETLFLGHGLGLMPKWAQDRGHAVCSVELDQEVIEATKALESHYTVIQGDVKLVVPDFEDEWFDFIFLDVYPVDPLVYHIDFFIKCKSKLKKGKTFSMNYPCDSQEEIDKMGKLLATTFDNVKMTVIYKDKDMKEPAQAVYFCA